MQKQIEFVKDDTEEMLGAVFICDREWTIQSFMCCSAELPLHIGDRLTEITEQCGELMQDDGSHRALVLTFSKMNVSIPAKIRIFPEGILVVLSHVRDDQDFITASQLYDRGVEWAKNHFQNLFHDEYFMIQQLNNQLIDSKRALARTNSRLKHTLIEVEQTNKELDQARQIAERAMKMAEKASQSKSTFLANMSHDIRTPMNAIVGLSSLMKYEIQNPEKLLEYIAKLQTTSQHLLGMLNDILDISKIESGTIVLRTETVDLVEQIKQIAAIARPQAQERKQSLEITGSYIQHTIFTGDAARTRQILLNLLSNAIKYTPEKGHIQFHIQELEQTDDFHTIYRFTVSDNGIGMSEQYLRHIFEPFSRSEESQQSGQQGTGLGMAIVKKLVDLMHGTIQVESVLEKGSKFVLELPVCLAEQNLDENVPFPDSVIAEAGQTAPSATEQSILHGMKILCAEDNALNAEILKTLLELEGAECKICEDGMQLVETFEETAQGTFDMILTDIQMPIMNGYMAVQKIRKSTHPQAETIPIIAMTANVFAEDIQKCTDAGMNAHVGKPVDIKHLEKTVKEVLTKKKNVNI